MVLWEKGDSKTGAVAYKKIFAHIHKIKQQMCVDGLASSHLSG